MLVILLANIAAVEHTTVFSPGEAGYNCIRIPSILLVDNATLLAFAECRNYTGDGCVPEHPASKSVNRVDLCMKRSNDAGATWSPLHVVARDGRQPTPVYDHARRRVLLNFNAADQNMAMASADAGTTWSAPGNVTQFLNMTNVFVGPGVGLALRSTNPHAPNRLLFIGHHGAYRRDYVWYTDDGGDTYHVARGELYGMDEAQLVELPDGRVVRAPCSGIMRPPRASSRRPMSMCATRMCMYCLCWMVGTDGQYAQRPQECDVQLPRHGHL
jgi:sialidase-1